METGSERYVHTLVGCAKLAFADREAWYGDPDHVEVPMEELLAPSYNTARAALIGDEASQALRPRSPLGREPRLVPAASGEAVAPARGADRPNG